MKPEVDPSALIVATAVVDGNVTIGARSSVWHHAVLRGDTDRIIVGAETNLQDHVIVHTDAGIVCRIGNRVTVGHAAIIHGATVEDECLIGIRATVLNGCTIGSGSIIAAGAVVPENTTIPERSVVMGIPARVVRPVQSRDIERIQRGWKHYVELASHYLGKT